MGDIEKATSQDEITAIREKLKTVHKYVLLFNKGGALSDNYAVKARIAREVYEHHEAVIRARANLGQNYGNVNQSTGDNGNRVEIADDAVYVGGSAGVGGTEQVNNDPASYSIGAERDGAEKRYHELYKEQIETDKRIHLDRYRPKQSRSNQSGFSYSQNRKGETPPVFQLFAFTITANK